MGDERAEEELVESGRYRFIVDLKRNRIYYGYDTNAGRMATYSELGMLDRRTLARAATERNGHMLYFTDDVSLFLAIPIEV
ncbi:MAG: hypothetical protein V1887_04245 [Candidatus Aenigmatarchaeota archaeon]